MYGKSSQKVRPSVQKSDLPGNRKRCQNRQRGLPGTAVGKSTCVHVVGQILERRTPETLSGQACSIGARERETEVQSGRAHHDGGRAKKNGKLEKAAEKRAVVRLHVKKCGSVSEACRIVGISSSSFYYRPKDRLKTAESEANLRDLIEEVQAELEALI